MGAGAPEAKAATVRCDGCTEQEVEDRVSTILDNSTLPSSSLLYVINGANGAVRKFQLEKSWANEGGDPKICQRRPAPIECSVIPYFVEIPVEKAISTYVGYAQAYGRGTDQLWLFPSENFPHNAYEAVQYPDEARNVGTWLKDGGIGWLQDFLTVTAAVNPFAGFDPSKIGFTVRTNYQNGGTSLYIYDHNLKTWIIIPNTSYDASGNLVPETQSDVSGGGAGRTVVYKFGKDTESLSEFIMRMGLLGVPISGAMGGQLTCSGTVESGRVVTRCSFN